MRQLVLVRAVATKHTFDIEAVGVVEADVDAGERSRVFGQVLVEDRRGVMLRRSGRESFSEEGDTYGLEEAGLTESVFAADAMYFLIQHLEIKKAVGTEAQDVGPGHV